MEHFTLGKVNILGEGKLLIQPNFYCIEVVMHEKC